MNSVADNLIDSWEISLAGIGLLTNAVQFGFVAGTLLFALSGIADRYKPSGLFAICALMGALFNALFALWADNILLGSVLRFLVGICLAGIYPIGMKLIMTWDPQKASTRIAQLVGMLTLGTAIPHATRYFSVDWPWQEVILFSSALAILAMAIIFWLGDGPHLSIRPQSRIKLNGIRTIFSIPAYRNSALGYFGHMWELYAFWALVPILISSTYQIANPVDLSGLAFLVIGSGAIGCFIGGHLSKTLGSVKVASYALLFSGLCCLLYPWIKDAAFFVQILFWGIWGMSVVADSPQFSAMSAQACPPELVGTALTIQNAIGFTITMISIQISTVLLPLLGNQISWLLLPGPILGLLFLQRLRFRA
jgi:MFS family permease